MSESVGILTSYNPHEHAERQIDALRLSTRQNAVDLLTVMLRHAEAEGRAKQAEVSLSYFEACRL